MWTIVGVDDVPGSFRWYQSLLGLPETSPVHDHFGQIIDSDGTVLLCLRAWGAHEHPSLTSPDRAQPGNGLLLFFRVDDFDMALPRVRALVARLEEEPHVNPNTRTAEFSLAVSCTSPRSSGTSSSALRTLQPTAAFTRFSLTRQWMPAFQRQGIGTELVRLAAREAGKRGCE